MDLRDHTTPPDRSIRTARVPGLRRPFVAASLLLIIVGPELSLAAQLQPETLAAWDHYTEQSKARMNSRLDSGNHFLWVDEVPDRTRRVRSGKILVAPVNG